MTTPLALLLVEDSATDAKLVSHALRALGRPLECERVDDEGAMRTALGRRRWDVVLSDWSLPKLSGPAALAIARELHGDVPFVIVSGTVGEEAAVEAMRAGAHDYVLKDKLGRLAAVVERELREHATRRALRSAEQTARDREARFRALVENSAEGIILTDLDGLVRYASPAAAHIYGIAAQDLVGTSLLDRVHPEDVAKAHEFRTRFTDAPFQVFVGRGRIVRPDGAVRWVELTTRNMVDDPAVGGVIRNIRDVTEQQEAAAALKASENRFARLAESGIVGISIARVDGTIIDANDALLRMLGYEREDLTVGRIDWRAITPPEWAETHGSALAQLARSGVAMPFEKEYLRKDGTRIPVVIAVAKLDETELITCVVDLTQQRRTEEALRRTDEQLRQAQKMEAIGRLAGGVAHDFNNLLSVILSYSALLSDGLPATDPMREDLQEINSAGKRATDLTRQLLTFSRQEVVEARVLDLNVALASTSKMLQRLVGEDIDLEWITAGDLGRVRADPSHIEQVVMNLVVNARDAMPKGGKLTIETKNVRLDDEYARDHVDVKAGIYVMLTITDTGTGMDKATQGRIFEPFFTTKEKGKGTGLGLSTVFGIVQQCKGHIWVYSEVGVGTTFRVYFPLVEGQADLVAPSRDPLTLKGVETILLVEDEEQIRIVTREILRRYGYTVLEARSAGEALLLSEQHSGTIHLLLTDVVMPHMSGPELAKRLANARTDLKVLCMSGYTDDALVRHGAIEAGVAYLQKPLTPEKLARKVRAVLGA